MAVQTFLICYEVKSTGYTPTKIAAKDIDTISVSPMAAIEDYVVQQLKMRKLYTLIFDNRLVKPLIEAAPGLHDAVQLGKIYDLQISGNWDHIVVDCPATGHGISLISATKTMMDVSRRGISTNRASWWKISSVHMVVVLVTSRDYPSKAVQLWDTMRANFPFKVLGIIVNQWANISPALRSGVP